VFRLATGLGALYGYKTKNGTVVAAGESAETQVPVLNADGRTYATGTTYGVVSMVLLGSTNGRRKNVIVATYAGSTVTAATGAITSAGTRTALTSGTVTTNRAYLLNSAD